MIVAIGSDHAGIELKKHIISLLQELKVQSVDLGTDTPQSVDYPDYGEKVAKEVVSGRAERGILICGTGVGMSIVANKFAGIRAALCNDLFTARMSRQHNNANILVIGGRIVGIDLAKEIVRIWMNTEFEGGRHASRLVKIKNIEEKNIRK
ncbi:MAG: ribose 5-phosphate isomerase B [Nitrospiraceae bacterium]|nr:ribose 5-phosphate isomerase B [Nitrospiraceae bacterium]